MKLFITDYDDTLYQNDDDIKDNITMIKRLQQHDFLIIISTGRSYPSIKNQINLFKIPYDILCCADGSIIYDKEGNVIKMFPMSLEIVKPLEKFYQNLKFEEIQFSYQEGYSNQLRERNNLLGINICLANENYYQKDVINFLKLKNKYPNYNYLNYTHPHYSYLCVKPINVSKSFSIEYLKNLYKVNDNDIYVIGDSSNDYEMIRDFHGVCMSNSCDNVLSVAKKKYSSVKEYIKDILEE